MYGTQTFPYAVKAPHQFENDVEMYGTQTVDNLVELGEEFENDVEMYGTQTFNERNTVERVV